MLNLDRRSRRSLAGDGLCTTRPRVARPSIFDVTGQGPRNITGHFDYLSHRPPNQLLAAFAIGPLVGKEKMLEVPLVDILASA